MMPGYLLTWTTYGTWLHGDGRGSHERTTAGVRVVRPDRNTHEQAGSLMKETVFRLESSQRNTCERVIRDECDHREWQLGAIAVLSNHIHVVVHADAGPEKVMGTLKARISRRLREEGLVRERVWTRHGSTRWLKDDASIRAAIDYVVRFQ